MRLKIIKYKIFFLIFIIFFYIWILLDLLKLFNY